MRTAGAKLGILDSAKTHAARQQIVEDRQCIVN